MKSPARNKKTVLRALRIPHEIDEKIRHISVANSLSYSACLVQLACRGIGDACATTPYGTMERESLAGMTIARIKGGSIS